MSRQLDVRVKRAYEVPSDTDGSRVLVDRLWPRGVSRKNLSLTLWLREIAPSEELREWFNHDPARFSVFAHRYRSELDKNAEPVGTLIDIAEKGPVTLVYSAHDTIHNNAVVLAEYLQTQPLDT